MANSKELAHNAQLKAELQRREKQRHFYRMFPDTGPLRRELYPRHMEFVGLTAEYNECGFVAGNRTGKTQTAAHTVAAWMTGIYPDWWHGKVFNGPVKCWACGDTNQTVRDVIQEALIGPPDDQGSGMIPGHLITDVKSKAGSVPNAKESFTVRHVSGKQSHCTFKSYDQKREAFQGTAMDVVWCDEEPPIDIYNECLTRTMTTSGIIICTFTPLRGLSDVVLAFMGDKYGDGDSDGSSSSNAGGPGGT